MAKIRTKTQKEFFNVLPVFTVSIRNKFIVLRWFYYALEMNWGNC
jgi:hypothetical protein